VVEISAAPVFDGRRVVGAVVVGVYVSQKLLNSFAAETRSSVSLIVGGVVQGSTLGRAEAVDGAFRPLGPTVRAVRDAQGPRRATFAFGGRRYLTALVPIRRSDGPTVGVLAFSRPTDVLSSPQRSINRTLFLVLLAASAVAALVAWLAGGRVSRPIRTLTGAVQQLRRGNLESRVSVDGRDEIGVLGSAFNEMAVSLQQTEKMKTEFLSNVSHELRTPLTPIKGYTDIMRRKALPRRKVVAFLEKIGGSADRLERIVEILVDFAAIEAGRLRPQAEAVPLRALLSAAVARWRERAPDHRFVLKAPAGLPPAAADPKRLERIVDELLDNAVKFSPRGGRVEVSAAAGEDGAGPLRVNIRDEGIGVEPDRVGALFADFQQLDGSETRTYGGLGLGLAYSRRIAQALGGDVRLAETVPGRGSTFSIDLPAADTEVGGKAPGRTNVRRRKKA
jgi:signal transduction histidine kinase